MFICKDTKPVTHVQSDLPSEPQRVVVYIDGFNLYYWIKEANLGRARWLDLTALSRNLLKPDQHLVKVKYSTARVKGPDKGIRERQDVYLRALETRADLQIIYGRFLGRKPGVYRSDSRLSGL